MTTLVSDRRAFSCISHVTRRLVLPILILVVSAHAGQSGSATWNLNPTSGDWNTAANWIPVTIPNGPNDTATFATSNTSDVSVSADTEVNGIVFGSGASAFTISPNPVATLTLSGTGIANNSGTIQNFVTT